MLRLTFLVSVIAFLVGGAPSYAVEPLPPAKGAVLLTVSGNIEQMNAPGRAEFDREMLEALGKASFSTGTEVSNKPQLFEGVFLSAVLKRIGAQGKMMRASALNDYETVIPFDDLKFEPLLAMAADGKLLTIRDKGPLWIIYPRDAHEVLHDVQYYARSVWQLNKLHIE
jgi:hypothetical protein